jgi:hypothetical protein
MVLSPADGTGVVLHCEGNTLNIFSRDEWESEKPSPVPLATLSVSEGLVLERFLRYWLQDEGDGPLYHEPGVNAQFEF